MLLALALYAMTAPANAGKTDAETCIEQKVWDEYKDGWQVRTALTSELSEGGYQVYLMTLYYGAEYRFQVCGDQGTTDVDIVLQKSDGAELLRDSTDDQQTAIGFKPMKTDSYYVTVYAAKLKKAAEKGAVSMAVAFR
jgi:hypothetical protein